jgi:hypothetical protein
MDDARDGDDVCGDPTHDPGQALDDADDDALTETDVDPTGNVLHNDPVRAAGAAAEDPGDGPAAST